MTRELTYVGGGRVEWRERPEPRLESRFDALVKPVAATICDVDRAILRDRAPAPPPFAIGHECVAQVVETAPGGTHVEPGELPLLEMYRNSVNLRIARDSVRAEIEPALDLAQSGRVDPRRVVSHVLEGEALPEELPKLHTKPVFVRAPFEAAQG